VSGGGAASFNSGGNDVNLFHMSFRQHGRGYHHGNLRDALLAAALDLIAERGLAALTFAEVARAVGVSAAAPYRHFRDLNALIGELALQGFQRFATELEAAWDQGRPDPVAAVENCGRAYLRFARREPAAYATMFDPGFPVADDPALSEASARAFGVLRQASEAAAATLPRPQRPPSMMMALHIWALAHGVAALFVGRAGGARFRLPMEPEELLEAGLLIYLQSLGLTARAG
jgi:AcrR family transcriptional regulator